MSKENQIENDLVQKLIELKYTYRKDIRDRVSLEKNYKRDNELKVNRDLQLEKEKLECIEIIKSIPLYKNLTERNQNYLINSACWKFTYESLQNKDFNKKKISVNQIIMNTGIKENTFKNWYSYSSTHIHTYYWSK